MRTSINYQNVQIVGIDNLPGDSRAEEAGADNDKGILGDRQCHFADFTRLNA